MTALLARLKNCPWSAGASGRWSAGASARWSAGASAPAALIHLLGLALALCLLAAPARAQGVNGAINSPGPNGTAIQPFTVVGWAIHGPGAGTGIDIVRVYGCLNPCAGPQTLWGTATYGVARPDVAAVYGQQYLNSGYMFTKAGLTPGVYYLKIEAHSTVTGNSTSRQRLSRKTGAWRGLALGGLTGGVSGAVYCRTDCGGGPERGAMVFGGIGAGVGALGGYLIGRWLED